MNSYAVSRDSYFFFAFFVFLAVVFFTAAFFAGFFLADEATVAFDFFLPPEKILSQLSAYLPVEPTRKIDMVLYSPYFELELKTYLINAILFDRQVTIIALTFCI